MKERGPGFDGKTPSCGRVATEPLVISGSAALGSEAPIPVGLGLRECDFPQGRELSKLSPMRVVIASRRPEINGAENWPLQRHGSEYQTGTCDKQAAKPGADSLQQTTNGVS